MSNNRFIDWVLFVLCVIGGIFDYSFEVWLGLEFAFLARLIFSLKSSLESGFPIRELITLVFFLDNAFAASLLHWIEREGNFEQVYSFTMRVPMEDYLPFVFNASVALWVGMNMVKIRYEIWRHFVRNVRSLVTPSVLNALIVLGIIGTLLLRSSSESVAYFFYILSKLLTCGLLGYALYRKSFLNVYVLTALGLQVFLAIYSGMFGGIIYFLIFMFIIWFLLLAERVGRINWLIFILAFGIAPLFLATMQNAKDDYRNAVWAGDKEANFGLWYQTISGAAETENVWKLSYYTSILQRLNQGYLVSAVMEKVPKEEPFANGQTIARTLGDILLPRFLNPDKERAGGKEKITRFTNIVLLESTSMNIGLLGEAYANFGKVGGVLFLILWGVFISFLFNQYLRWSLVHPFILLLFPVYLEVLIGSGTDFLMVLNSLAKATFVIFLLTRILK